MSDSDTSGVLSRDTIVHINIVVVAWFLLGYVAASAGRPAVTTAATIGFAAVVFGGSHLYLWFRGEDGEVPAESRARWILTLSVIVALFGSFNYFGGTIRSALGVDPMNLVFVVGVSVLVGYFVVEGRAAYRDSYVDE